MEGRAIARPNRAPKTRTATEGSTFNGGPGNCPAKRLSSPRSSRRLLRSAFNGGPGNCPAKLSRHSAAERRPVLPSMEGRAIARPNFGCARPPTSCASASLSFNGGPGNCPAKQHHRGGTLREGAIRGVTFNGGPGNCPAKPHVAPGVTSVRTPRPDLQWRAGQLPGQTVERGRCSTPTKSRSPFNGGPGNCPAKRGPASSPLAAPRFVSPSMEGRAIARPNPGGCGCRAPCRCGLQWRAGQLPGQTTHGRRNGGQLPGQTAFIRPRTVTPSMEGRAIARPNGQSCQTIWSLTNVRRMPSMEGRAIARPNRSLDLGSLTCPFAGACERSRQRELRRCPDSVVKLRFALRYKASSGPRDLRAHHSARIR